MQYFLFLDESGDHGLGNIDPGFPVFALTGVMISRVDYLSIRHRMNQIKETYWNDRDVIFHSRDIRKWDKEFKILFDEEVRARFYRDINDLVSQSNYTIIAAAVDKIKHTKKYGKIANDPYELSVSFILERAVFFLDNQQGRNKLKVIIEKRGGKEDKKLSSHCQKVKQRGTYYVNSSRFGFYEFSFEFLDKRKNINGLQLADLIAYPLARYVMDPKRANPSFETFEDKIYAGGARKYGLKIFP